ncbi:SPW repeat protein [Raineyella sp. LH-20]|uniref:SPW repeat protein n=1 Tax=Raineyella sp. LH-20 TaxID=3081204 RepID=UPI002953BF7B|nr:SPW repeat protein [Raineyella sp. LH-20]WOP19329.1 SPW repeat protein [Raineyella sp. LH-20]
MSAHPAVHVPWGAVARRHWEDWLSILAGLYLVLSPLWLQTQQPRAIWLVPFGVVLIVFGAWSEFRERASAFAEGMVALAGAFIIASPWIGGFAGLNALAISAWAVGAVAIVMAIFETISRRRRVVEGGQPIRTPRH